MGLSQNIAREFAQRNREALESGTVNKKQLARAMYEAHPEAFPTLEAARTAIRHATGAGNPKAKAVFEFKSTQAHGLKALKTRAVKREDFRISGLVLVLSDIHLPYHDPEALEIAVQHGVDAGCETLLINGDLMDCYHFSKFVKDPTQVNFAEELAMTKQFFDTVCPMFQRVVFKLGNHEDRLEHYLWTKAPELVGMPFTSMGQLLEADDRGIEMVGSRQLVKAAGTRLSTAKSA